MTGGIRKERVWYCDALRVLAIALVVLLHTFADWREMYFITSKPCYFLLTCLQIITRVAVPIFFMLTGAFMLGRTRDEKYTTFLKTRVMKLLIPFVIISGIYYLFDIYNNFTMSPKSLWEFGVEFSNNGIKYHFWYMYAIILIYLLLPFLNKMVLNLSKKDLQILIIIIAGSNLVHAISYIAASQGTPVLAEWSYPNIICYINYLFLGYYLHRYGVERKWRKWLYLAGGVALVLMPVLDILTAQVSVTDALFVAGSIGPFLAAMAVFVAFQSKPWKWSARWKKFFTLTAPLVFYIYMVHVLIMDFTKQTMLKIWAPQHFVEVCGFIAVEFILTFGLSYVVSLGVCSAIRLYNKRRQSKA